MNYKLILFILVVVTSACQISSDEEEFLVERFYSYSQPLDFDYPDTLEYKKYPFGAMREMVFSKFPIENKIVRCDLTYFKAQLMSVRFIIEPKDYGFFKKRYLNQKLSSNIGFRISDGDCTQNPGMPNYVANKYCFQWGDNRLIEDYFEYYPDGNVGGNTPLINFLYYGIY